jgi:hypothetical protein
MTVDPRHEAWDADLECRHGRVPFDPSPVCHCFPVEEPGYQRPVATVIPLPVRRPLKKRDRLSDRLCLCGCGGRVRVGRQWLMGHNKRKQAA